MQGFKGFDKNFQCRGKQYAVGETFTEKCSILCKKGMHFVTKPEHVFKYYVPGMKSRYAEVEAEKVSMKRGRDSKRVCKKMTIIKELSIRELIESGLIYKKKGGYRSRFQFQAITHAANGKRGVSVIGNESIASVTGSKRLAAVVGDNGIASVTSFEGIAYANGYQSAACTTNNFGAAYAAGIGSIACAIGNEGSASAEGKSSFAIACGMGGIARGILGTWLILAEWKLDPKGARTIAEVKSVRVDGEIIKEMVYYRLKDGKFEEA